MMWCSYVKPNSINQMSIISARYLQGNDLINGLPLLSNEQNFSKWQIETNRN